jgi:serine/threonine protein kinase
MSGDGGNARTDHSMSPDIHGEDGEAAGFAAVRAQFHRLAELDADARSAALSALDTEDNALAASVRELFARFDARDLDAPRAPAPLSQIGPFRVLRQLGRGGMGEVFEGERNDGAFEQQVALKLIRADYAGLGLDERFRRERQILARLQHPHIARLIDGGVTLAGQAWLAMEYVDGVDLAAWVAAARPSLRRRISLFISICEAVAFAHRALIVHRDLKPANILVAGDDTPKLLDFGIAKLVDDEADSQTRTALPALTLRYAAPEQVLGDRTTTATDVYALGVLLFELIAAVSPYALAQHGDVPWSEAIVRGQVRPLAAALDATSGLAAVEQRQAARELGRVIERAMALSPSDRYSGAAALADDLRDWLDERPLRSGVGTLRERVRLQLFRYRWPLLSAAAVMVALLVGGVIALQQTLRARDEAAIAEANMQGMLDVLGELEVIDYTEPDPPLSKALTAAGERLQREFADRPDYLWRALGAIGRTLHNRHRPDLAAPLLVATEAALARDPHATPRQRFDFAVMRYSAAVPESATEIDRQAKVIAGFAVHAEPDNVLSELATTAYGLSLYGKSEAALALVRVGDVLTPAQLAAATQSTRDDYFVRRGDIEWRAGEHAAAARAFARVDVQNQATAPVHAVQALRMRAELALRTRQFAVALPAIEQARARAAGAELYPGDRERLALTEANVRLGLGETDAAQALVKSVLDVVRAQAGARHVRAELRSALWLQARLLAQSGDCDAARSTLAEAETLMTGPTVGMRVVRDEAASARAAVASACD